MEFREKYQDFLNQHQEITFIEISIEDFTDHEDGVSCLGFCDNSVYSASFDNTIRFWKIDEMFDRILDRKMMAREELMSKKMEAYYKVLKGKR